jgi:hypothetical protein
MDLVVLSTAVLLIRIGGTGVRLSVTFVVFSIVVLFDTVDLTLMVNETLVPA